MKKVANFLKKSEEKKVPPKSVIQKLVEAYGLKIYSARLNATFKKQQLFHDKFEKMLDTMQKKYPHIDMASNRFYDQLKASAEKWWGNQAIKGSGKHW
jgi:hypothetical protein